MRRNRSAKIVATIGPASSTPERMRALVLAGADVFRINFSHGTHAEHKNQIDAIRALEPKVGRRIGVLMDLQGPKLRVGAFGNGPIVLRPGQRFRLDLDRSPGGESRVCLPHPEIFAALETNTPLLLDDGKMRLRVLSFGKDYAETEVEVGGTLSERKGVNVPGVVLPISPLTAKDLADLEFGLSIGVDWVALSFVQRPEDIDEARKLVGKKAFVMAKLEKPAAIEHLDAIVGACDGIMVARGDLGVEMAPEEVPTIQRTILNACRRESKPVIVATQMLESMVTSPVPTRAEASDVATAIYEGADATMLSAESAVGQYPVEAVAIMDRIIQKVESDKHYRSLIDSDRGKPGTTIAEAICASARFAAGMTSARAIITYTSSGLSTMRAAGERPEAPIVSLTPSLDTARRLALVWGVHSVHSTTAPDVNTVTDLACAAALAEGFAKPGDIVVIVAGIPFSMSGTTNLMRIARVWPAEAPLVN